MKFESFTWCCVVTVFAVIPRCYSEDLSDFDNKNIDIWNFEETTSGPWAEQAFQAICNQYDLITKNGKISCEDISLSIKLLSEDNSFEEHDIVKRQIEEEEEDVEGSGEPGVDENTPLPPIAEQTEKIELVTNQPEKLEEVPTVSTIKIIDDDVHSVTMLQRTDDSSASESEVPTNKTAQENEQNEPTSVELKAESPSSTVKTETMEKSTTIPQSSNENSTPISDAPLKGSVAEETTVKPSLEVNVDENKKESEGIGKDTDKVTKIDNDNEETKEKEHIDEQQDANTEILKHPVLAVAAKGIEMSESEKILNHMEVSSENKVGESSSEVTKASKDTTILIVLFVVVVVIGGAAFTYNKVKQRRNKRSSNSANTINGKPANDVEQGTELKPLMNNTLSDQKLANSNEIKSEEITERS